MSGIHWCRRHGHRWRGGNVHGWHRSIACKHGHRRRSICILLQVTSSVLLLLMLLLLRILCTPRKRQKQAGIILPKQPPNILSTGNRRQSRRIVRLKIIRDRLLHHILLSNLLIRLKPKHGALRLELMVDLPNKRHQTPSGALDKCKLHCVGGCFAGREACSYPVCVGGLGLLRVRGAVRAKGWRLVFVDFGAFGRVDEWCGVAAAGVYGVPAWPDGSVLGAS